MEEQLLLFDDPRKKTNRFASQQDMAEYIEENCRWNKVNFYSVAETAAFLCLSEDEVEHLIEYYYLDAVHIEGVVRIPYNASCATSRTMEPNVCAAVLIMPTSLPTAEESRVNGRLLLPGRIIPPRKNGLPHAGCRSLRLSTNRRTAHQPQNHPI